MHIELKYISPYGGQVTMIYGDGVNEADAAARFKAAVATLNAATPATPLGGTYYEHTGADGVR